MNSAERLVFATRLSDQKARPRRKSASPVRLQLLLVLVILASMILVSALSPAESDTPVAREPSAQHPSVTAEMPDESLADRLVPFEAPAHWAVEDCARSERC